MSIPVIPSKKIGLSGITLPQNIQPREPEPQEQLAFDTDKYGELVVTGIGGELNTGDKISGITIKTNQGDFLFVSDSYINKGYVYEWDVPGKRDEKPVQYYSRAFVGDQRDEIFNSAVAVDLSAIPEKVSGSRGRKSIYGITGGTNNDLSKLVSKKGLLIPQDVVDSTGLKVNAYRFKDDVGGITGIANTSNNPYIDEKFVYAREGSETAPRGSVDIRYIDQNGLPRYTYSWQDSGGMFSNFTGIGFIDNTLGGISDALANIEDIGREGIEGVDAALQNPYVNAVVKVVAAVSPDPVTKAIAAGIDAYTTVDSGEDLSAGQVVNLATSTAGAIQASGGAGGTMSADGGPPQTGGATDTSAFDSAVQAATDETVQKIAGAGASIIDGADPLDVAVNVFSNEIIEGVADTADTTIGKEAGDAIRNNPDITNTVIDVAQGDDVSTAIANNLGDRVAEGIGADTTNEIALVKAGLSTGAGLDQGLDTDEALLEGAKTYYEEGGTIPGADVDVEVDGFSLSDLGIDLGAFPDFVGDINARFPTIPAVALSLFEGGLSIPEIEGLGIDISGVDFPTADLGIDTDLEFGDVDLGLDGVDLDVGDVDLGIDGVDLDVGDVDLGIDGVDLGEVDIDTPKVEGPDIDGPDIDGPDIDIDLDFSREKGMLLDDEDSPVFELMQYAFAQGLDPLGQIRPVLPRLNNYLTNKES